MQKCLFAYAYICMRVVCTSLASSYLSKCMLYYHRIECIDHKRLRSFQITNTPTHAYAHIHISITNALLQMSCHYIHSLPSPLLLIIHWTLVGLLVLYLIAWKCCKCILQSLEKCMYVNAPWCMWMHFCLIIHTHTCMLISTHTNTYASIYLCETYAYFVEAAAGQAKCCIRQIGNFWKLLKTKLTSILHCDI